MSGSGKRSLLALAVLLWASCGSSSGKNNGDALGGGGVTGGDGAAGGPPSGNAGGTSGATGGTTGGGAAGSGGSGGTTGGSGGTSGGYGGSGGTPSVCSDPMYPVSCPALGDVPAICWSTGTDCSTVTKCGNDFRSCNAPNSRFDCSTMTCVSSTAGDGGAVAQCSGTGFPVACPAKDDVPALCWSPGTVCSTISRCNNEFKSCQAAGYHFSCALFMCVPDTASATDAGAADVGAADVGAAADAASTDGAAHD